MKTNKGLQAKEKETPKKLSDVFEENGEISDDELDGVTGGAGFIRPVQVFHKKETKPN